MRIRVVGPSGSGKSTLAARLAERLDIPHVELDALYHQADWEPADPAVFADAVRTATAGEGWVLDGNYRSVLPPDVSARVERMVWLDLPRWIVLPALLRRTLTRGLLRRELWNGNRERLGDLLCLDPERNLVVFTAGRIGVYRSRYFTEMIDGGCPVWRCRSRQEVDAAVERLGRMAGVSRPPGQRSTATSRPSFDGPETTVAGPTV